MNLLLNTSFHKAWVSCTFKNRHDTFNLLNLGIKLVLIYELHGSRKYLAEAGKEIIQVLSLNQCKIKHSLTIAT